MARLTKRFVDAAEPATRRRFLWDESLPGFGLVVHATGRKVYVVQYRNAEGRTRRQALGVHGVLTPDQARRLAAAHLVAARSGRDPVEENRVAQRGLTVSELADRYLAEHLPKKKDSSAREDRRILKAYVLSALGSRKVAEVTSGEIARLHVAMRSTPIMANRVLFLLSTLFNLSERWGLRESATNPCRHVQRFRELRRQRFLSDEEMGRLGAALRAVEREEGASRSAIAAIRLLLLTGARRGEVLRLRWEQVDLERGMLLLADSKTGRRAILIDDFAAAVLRALPRTGSWVFPSPKKSASPIHDIRKTWQRVLDKAEIRGFRLHDLRHTHASVGAALGLSLPMIGGLLGHRRSATTERYAHLVDDAQRAAAGLVQRRIAEDLAAEHRHAAPHALNLTRGGFRRSRRQTAGPKVS